MICDLFSLECLLLDQYWGYSGGVYESQVEFS